jgi:hypothetical protein
MCFDIWGFVWLRPGLDASGLEWRECLGDDRWAVLRDSLFMCCGMARCCQLGDDSYLILDSRTGHGLIHESSGQVMTWDLSESDARCYRVDPTALRDMVADALEISAEPGDVRDCPLCFPLGAWCPIHGVSVPTFMMLPPTVKLLTSEIQRLLLRIHCGFILFVPQMPRLDTFLRDQLDRHHAAVISLQEMVAWDEARFCATSAWQTYRNAYCARHLPERMVPAPPLYEFAKTGDYWSIRFGGQFVAVRDAIGLSYIAHLLANPHRQLHVLNILRDVTGQTGIASSNPTDHQTDPQAIEQVKQQYITIQQELEEAEHNNDMATLDRLQRELDDLTDYLARAHGLGGQIRRQADDADKIRRAMSQAICRAIDALAHDDMLPDAALHLRNAITTGMYMSYSPEEDLLWSL